MYSKTDINIETKMTFIVTKFWVIKHQLKGDAIEKHKCNSQHDQSHNETVSSKNLLISK